MIRREFENWIHHENFINRESRYSCPQCHKGKLIGELNSLSKSRFIRCSRFPECCYAKSLHYNSCLKCFDGVMTEKVNSYSGVIFSGCSNYPECMYTESLTIPAKIICPECKIGYLITYFNKKTKTNYLKCTRFPQCKCVKKS